MSEQISKEVLINKASDIMDQLDIYSPYTTAWKKHQLITMYENYAGFYIDPAYGGSEELLNKIREIEEQYGIMVYAVTHEYTSFGELYDLLYLSTSVEDDAYNKIDPAGGNSWYVPAYVLNVSEEWCSEFGDVIISTLGGGLSRIG